MKKCPVVSVQIVQTLDAFFYSQPLQGDAIRTNANAERFVFA